MINNRISIKEKLDIERKKSNENLIKMYQFCVPDVVLIKKKNIAKTKISIITATINKLTDRPTDHQAKPNTIPVCVNINQVQFDYKIQNSLLYE